MKSAVGESPSRRADVEKVGAAKIEREPIDEPLKFFTAAGDEARWLFDGEFEVGGEFLAGFVETGGAVEDAAGHDQRLGLRARFGEAASDEKFVETLFE